jgi:hypothetical protein
MNLRNLTRQQAIETTSLGDVAKVESLNCDYTNRLLGDGSNLVEFSATITLENGDQLVAIYYQDKNNLDDCGDDLSNLDWSVDHFQLV